MLELFLILWIIIIHFAINQRGKSRYYILIFLPFAVLMGCRDISVGLDTYQYAYGYENMLTMSWSDVLSTNDPVWLAMEKLSSYICADYYFWQCLYALIYFAIYSRFIKHYCTNKLLAIVIFLSTGLYTYAFNISRQMLSIAFFILAWDSIIKKEIKRSIFFYVLSILTHVSSIVSFPILLLTKLELRRSLEKLLPVFIVVLLSSATLLISHLGVYIPHYDKYLDNIMATNGGGLIKVVWAIELLFALYVYYFAYTSSRIYKVAALGTMIYVGANVVGFSFNYAERLGYIYMPFVLLVFDQIYLQIKNRNSRKILSCAEVLCFLIFFYLAFSGLEYKSFFL